MVIKSVELETVCGITSTLPRNEGVFYEDAANDLIEAEYPKAAEESGLEIVSRPEIDVDQIEKGKSFIFTAKVAVKPDVELGKYKGVEVDKLEIEVTDEEVNAEIDKEREKNSRMVNVEDRPSYCGLDSVNDDLFVIEQNRYDDDGEEYMTSGNARI